MKSLLFDARMKQDSGIGVYIQNMLPALKQHFNLSIIGSEQGDLNINAPIYSISEQKALSKLKFRKGQAEFDLMWSPHYNVPFISPAKKSIVTIHDVFHLAFFETLTVKQKLYAQIMLRKAAASDLIFTVSEFSKKEIIKHLGTNPDKIKVVYNGVDIAHFSKVYDESQSQKLKVKYQLDQRYILFVGNVKPHKNLVNALLAFECYVKDHGNTETLNFLIVGKREGFITGDPAIAAMCEKPFFKDRIKFTGWVPDEDLPFLYQNARVFLFSSLYEGFGFPPLEAMAAGCPVISSDAACMPEIYGDAVIYYNAKSANSGSEALAKVLTGKVDLANLKEKGINQVLKYTWKNATQRSIETIDQSL